MKRSDLLRLSPILGCVTALGSSPRPLRADAARNRARLIEAARELFAERGLHVTMDEIARHAGVGVGTAYRRFASREELISALFDDRIEQVVAIAEAAAADPDPWRGLTRWIEASIEMQAADRGLKELLLSPGDLRARMVGVRERMMPLFEGLIERAKADGLLRPDVDPLDLPPLMFMLGAAADFGGDMAPDLWRRYLVVLLDGLRAHPHAPTPLPQAPLPLSRLDDAMANCHARR
jgi:AcrR family transcriptional regulator